MLDNLIELIKALYGFFYNVFIIGVIMAIFRKKAGEWMLAKLSDERSTAIWNHHKLQRAGEGHQGTVQNCLEKDCLYFKTAPSVQGFGNTSVAL